MQRVCNARRGLLRRVGWVVVGQEVWMQFVRGVKRVGVVARWQRPGWMGWLVNWVFLYLMGRKKGCVQSVSSAEGHFGVTCCVMQLCQQGGRVDANCAKAVVERVRRSSRLVVDVVERGERIAE